MTGRWIHRTTRTCSDTSGSASRTARGSTTSRPATRSSCCTRAPTSSSASTRFFASLAEYDPHRDRYSIDHVMGPDDSHDGYPDRPGAGVRDNAYTNVMTAWVLRRAIDGRRRAAAASGPARLATPRASHPARSRSGTGSRGGSRSPSTRTAPSRSSTDPGRLEPIDLDGLPAAVRMDRPARPHPERRARHAEPVPGLEAARRAHAAVPALGRGVARTARRHGLRPAARSRRAHRGTVLRHVNMRLDALERRALVARGPPEPGSAHGSSCSGTLQSDLSDIQGGSTREGVHIGAMAGSVDMVTRCYAGIEMRLDGLWFHPGLPMEITAVKFHLVDLDEALSWSRSPRRSRASTSAEGSRRPDPGGSSTARRSKIRAWRGAVGSLSRRPRAGAVHRAPRSQRTGPAPE